MRNKVYALLLFLSRLIAWSLVVYALVSCALGVV
jgi:hypothetical protein